MEYEEKISMLEEISKNLEKDLPIKDAIGEYTKGATLIKDCLEELENSKGTITKVKQEMNKYIEEKMK